MDRYVHWTGTDGADILRGGPEQNFADGLGGDDLITTDGGNDIIDGGAGNDQLRGGGGMDLIAGGDGRDAIWGGSGNDHITGGSFGGDESPLQAGDRIDAGAGNDLVEAGLGHDVITLGAGHDTLHAVVNEVGRDIGLTELTDFHPGQDHLSLFVGGASASDPSVDVPSALDSNHDGVIGKGDAHVTVAHGNLTIHLGDLMDETYGTGGHGGEQVTLDHVTALHPSDFA